MVTLATAKCVFRPLCLRLDPGSFEADSDFSLALERTLSNLEVSVAVAYRFDNKMRDFAAVAWHSCIAPPSRVVSSELSPAGTQYLRELEVPVQCAAGEELFESFPETRHCDLDRIVIIPLFVRDNIRGLLTVGVPRGEAFPRGELEEALVGARLLRLVFERDDLERNLASRKLVERAKGILQRTRRLTEEEAYLALRNMGRYRRHPMADVARDIIDADLRRRLREQE
jgi:hypothetical protein